LFSCYECESARDTTNDVSASCWAVDGKAGDKTDAKCHGCYVARTEESTEEGKDSSSNLASGVKSAQLVT